MNGPADNSPFCSICGLYPHVRGCTPERCATADHAIDPAWKEGKITIGGVAHKVEDVVAAVKEAAPRVGLATASAFGGRWPNNKDEYAEMLALLRELAGDDGAVSAATRTVLLIGRLNRARALIARIDGKAP